MIIEEYEDHEDLMPMFDGEYNPSQESESLAYQQEREDVYADFLRSAKNFFGADTLKSSDSPIEICPPMFFGSRKLGIIVNDSQWETPELISWMREWVSRIKEDYMITVDMMSGNFGQVFICVTRHQIALSGSARAAKAFDLERFRP